MPGKKQVKPKAQKKRSKSGPSNIPHAGPYPPSMVCQMNYSEILTLTEAGAGGGAYQMFRAGDVYDPDLSGAGHQPLYFDQLCTSTGPYSLHTTLKAVFHFRVVNMSSTPIMVVAYPTMASSVPTRTATLERPYSWKKLLPPVGTGGAMSEKRIALDNPKFVGVPLATYEAGYSGNYGSSANCPLMVFSIWGLGASVATATIELNIVYTTKFYQLGLPSSS